MTSRYGLKKDLEIIEVSNVFQKGKTHIPIAIRNKLEIKDGDKMVWFKDGEGRIIIEKMSLTR